MNPKQHEKRDDMKVWLSQDEVTVLLDVALEDVVDIDAGAMLGVGC